MPNKSRVLLSIAAAGAISIAWPTLAQNAPQENQPAYTTSPSVAGITSVDSDSPPIPIGIGVQRSGGSLLRAETMGQEDSAAVTTSSASFYDVPEPKPKLLKKHDLVTIVIAESSAVMNNDVTDLSRQNNLDAILNSYVMLGSAGGGLSLVEHAPTTPIQIQGSTNRQFQGNGNIQRQDTVTGRITAEVVDVKPNGTLILEATEDIKTDDEDQKLTLLGTCRVEDITAANTIISNQLFNLTLNKQNKGAVKDANNRSILYRVLDFFHFF
jgi:flagellar basal body L-ring protein FlgH